MASSPYLTLAEAAAFARCSKRTIQRWLDAGTLTRYGYGRRPLVGQEELARLLTPTPEASS